MALFSLLNWNLESRLQRNQPPPTLKSTLSNLHKWVRRFHRSSSCSPRDDVGDAVVSGGLGHSFEGLQYEVGLMDEPVCADEDIYCPENKGKFQRDENDRDSRAAFIFDKRLTSNNMRTWEVWP